MDTPNTGFKPLDIKGFRKTYYNSAQPYFTENDASDNPFIQFDNWFKDACTHNEVTYEEVNAVCLSTCANNRPSSRMVLLKKYDKSGFSFFTNSISRKGKELEENSNASLLFYWPFVNRQIRIEGRVEKLPVKEVDDYWESRPLNSRIGGAVSQQSSVVPSRKYLEDKYVDLNLLAHKHGHQVIKRPETWSGYTVFPDYFEFWQGQSDRLHDRLAYKLETDGSWTLFRLSP